MYEKMEVFLDNFFSPLGQFRQIRVLFLRTFCLIRRRLIVFLPSSRLARAGAFAQFLVHAKNVRRARAVGRFFRVPFAVSVERFRFFLFVFFFCFFAGFTNFSLRFPPRRAAP